ncbi:SDR family NAD(P)-dependent oxidoreductase [Terricaulis silvestris]|uniref:D-xylose 1-dehydrogenase n=1 Tax=Terricaulis silvestris TaxID=2686094 RepID=A0A6I6MYB9_9CAUL|nr:SDR family oxidoreductase [Terricaulis silvestris]QGZ96153.1 4-formylbenzenesulfonate dehydrogenase TsaC1/TsaC2 [Terricaulis silvestris]
MGRFTGKVVIVTGSTQGLGEGIALRFAKEGARVVINGRSRAKGEAVMAKLHAIGADALFLPADLSNKPSAQTVVSDAATHFGRVDILVNNAQAQTPHIETLDPANDGHFESTMRSGLYASLWTAQAAFPHMRAAGAGRVINFASTNGVFGAKYGAAYNACKEAIQALTRTLANEWGQYGITVNTVLPSGMSPSYAAFFEGDPKRAEASANAIPLRRHGRAEEDIGAAIAGLCSDSGSFITGQALFIDGGQSLLGMPQLHTLGYDPHRAAGAHG